MASFRLFTSLSRWSNNPRWAKRWAKRPICGCGTTSRKHGTYLVEQFGNTPTDFVVCEFRHGVACHAHNCVARPARTGDPHSIDRREARSRCRFLAALREIFGGRRVLFYHAPGSLQTTSYSTRIGCATDHRVIQGEAVVKRRLPATRARKKTTARRPPRRPMGSGMLSDLGIAPRTVHTHIERLHRKLEAIDRLQLVLSVVREFLRLTISSDGNLPPICANEPPAAAR